MAHVDGLLNVAFDRPVRQPAARNAGGRSAPVLILLLLKVGCSTAGAGPTRDTTPVSPYLPRDIRPQGPTTWFDQQT